MATPFMGMVLPIVSTTIGPLYAYENNQAFAVIDAHDHSPGKGVQIPTAGISINADLAFNSFNATLLRSSLYQNQSSPLTLPTDIRSIYVVGGDLYYNNGIGQQIQITAGAALNAASIGGIGGDYTTSGASVFYTSADTTYTFWSAPNTSGSIDSGPITLRNDTLNSFGVTISPSPTLSSNFPLTLFGALPASTKILTVDSSGNIGDVYDVDNSTLEVSSNTLRVKAAGITSTQIAPGAVSQAQLGAANFQMSASCGVTTVSFGPAFQPVFNLNVNITTTGRPVMMFLQSAGPGNNSYLSLNGGSDQAISMAFFRDTTQLSQDLIRTDFAASNTALPLTIHCFDAPAAGTYNYNFQVLVQFNNGTPAVFNNFILTAYEI